MHIVCDDDSDIPQKCRSRSAPAARTYRADSPLSASSEKNKCEDSRHMDSAQVDDRQHHADGVEGMEFENCLRVMIRNIPCNCTRDEILKAIEEVGFAEKHDFIYTPMKKGKALGYKFIGFPDPQVTKEFVKSMIGYRFVRKMSSKIVTVTPAAIQGPSNNMDRFENTFVMKTDAKPTLSRVRVHVLSRTFLRAEHRFINRALLEELQASCSRHLGVSFSKSALYSVSVSKVFQSFRAGTN